VDDRQRENIHGSAKKKMGTVWGDSGGTGLLGRLRLQGEHAFSEWSGTVSEEKNGTVGNAQKRSRRFFLLDVLELLELDESTPKDRAKNSTVFGSDNWDATSPKTFKQLDVHVVVVHAQR
jgi:hypothetical protein